MDSLTTGELKKIMEKLVSEISCPVCLITLRSPVRLCTNGHGVCGACRAELGKCPLCRQPFSSSSSRNVLLNGILDLLPQGCRFNGCQAFDNLEDDKDHEKWCGYQTTTCKVFNCAWTGCAKDILDHIRRKHKTTEIMGEESVSVGAYDQVVLRSRNCIPLSARGNFFWIHTSCNLSDKTVDVDFIHVPNGRLKSSFSIKLLYGHRKLTYSSSIYVTPENVFNKDEVSMSFVYSKVKNLVDSEGYISFALTVEKD